jgi:DNA-binding NtrC family response regulator
MALVLVVDDEEEVRRVVEVMLKNAGHEVVLAVDGDDALRQFRQRHSNLVICDVFMPSKVGMETLKEIPQLDSAVLVIMMSGGAPTTFFGEQRIEIIWRWQKPSVPPKRLRSHSNTRSSSD